jgi:hypothetical protein
MYAVLFLGLPVVGLALYVRVRRRMAAEGIADSPVIPLFLVFASYGAVLLFAVSEAFGVWSGMHSLAAVALVLVAAPWLLIQGILLLRDGAPTVYHRATAALSLAFPLVLAALAWVALRRP